MNPSKPDTILIAEDSPEMLGMLADTLESAGFIVMIALRGDRALAIARQAPPDLILLDALMPGMDGFETCKQLKHESALADIPVIFMTGLTDPEDVVRGLEAGGIDYITKPVDPRTLVARVRVHLENSRAGKRARDALDHAGRHLAAIDTDGKLKWWTQHAGELLEQIMQEPLGLGASLPAKVINGLAHKEGNSTVEIPTKTGGSITISIQTSSWDQGETLLRIREASCPAVNEVENNLARPFDLSAREVEVLDWVSQGKSNRDIAQILDLSPRTINKHLERIFKKIGVENRTAAAALMLKKKTMD